MRQSQQKSFAFLICWNVYEASMTNSVDPDQTAPIRAVWSGSTLFASILKFVSNVRQLFEVDDFSRCNFSDALFLGALRVKSAYQKNNFLISQPKQMLWVLKRTVSLRDGSFEHPKHNFAKLRKYQQFLCWKFYLNLWIYLQIWTLWEETTSQ